MQYHDSIAAIATPIGSGGIGIIRVSGSLSKEILQSFFKPASNNFTDFRPYTLHRGCFRNYHGEILDDVLAVFMPTPNTFTGEDIAEIHCHGGQVLILNILEEIINFSNVRLAQPGEFSRRAFINGRMDLTQAEAIAQMISAKNKSILQLGSNNLRGLLSKQVIQLRSKLEQLRMQLCVAVDFPEDEVDCLSPNEFGQVVEDVHSSVLKLLSDYNRTRPWQDGASVVLAGAVNAGKSSTLNALLGYNRALVSDLPGTTRDFLEESLLIDGLSIKLIDTAGLREALDSVEKLGIKRSKELISKADAVLLILDGEYGAEGINALGQEGLELALKPNTLIVWNKYDLSPKILLPVSWPKHLEKKCLKISAKLGLGLEELCKSIKQTIFNDKESQNFEPNAYSIIPNMRQAKLLNDAAVELAFLKEDIAQNLPYDICSVRLDSAVVLLGQITGLDTPDELLDNIFATFCIGK